MYINEFIIGRSVHPHISFLKLLSGVWWNLDWRTRLILVWIEVTFTWSSTLVECFLVVMLCNVVVGDWCFRGPCCLHLFVFYHSTTQCHNTEELSLNLDRPFYKKLVCSIDLTAFTTSLWNIFWCGLYFATYNEKWISYDSRIVSNVNS